MEVYLPKNIERIYKEIPEKVEEYLKKYSYEGQVEKYAQVMLKHYGVGREKSYYQDCCSNASLGYLYSIGRCAYCGYEDNHVKNYIKKMIRISIINGINASNEAAHICRSNNLRAVYLDGLS